MSRAAALLAIALAAAVAAAGGALAAEPNEPLIYVPLDHVVAGRSFPLVGARLAPDATVRFRITHDDVDVRLGTTKAGPEGGFRTTLRLPANFPDGYAFLTAGTEGAKGASMWLLVGERAGATSAGGESFWSRNAAVIVLVAVLAGAAVAAAALLAGPLRRRRSGVRA